MKYFTDELINQSIFDDNEELERQWEVASKAYRESLEQLKSRVSKSVWEMAYNNTLHDARFIRIVVEYSRSKTHPIIIKLLFMKGDNLLLEYKKVSCFKTSFGQQLAELGYLGIDDCVYSELLKVDEDKFSHELIFSSGARFYFEFEKIILKRN